MKEEIIARFIEEKRKVCISLKTGSFYKGFILVLGDNSVLFKDKFGDEMMFSLDIIESIVPARDNEDKEKSKGKESPRTIG